MADLNEFQKALGYEFKDLNLLKLALTHPSVAHEAGAGIQHNQRLEFLGDAVLQLVLTCELYSKFPGFGEGPLTKARAQLVNRRMLAEHGRQLKIGDYLMVSRGEEISGGRTRPSALADAFEAIVGAIFTDGEYGDARIFILSRFKDIFGELKVIPTIDNPKGELQELLQADSNEPPQYRLDSMTGPDHDRVFVCTVHHRGLELGRGTGKNKKEAESQAALEALLKLRNFQAPGNPC
ncbi:MAG: ribonuclease III [Verrucomicrobiales bacterium]